jgi:DNA-binding transcriptional LysR family regulator
MIAIASRDIWVLAEAISSGVGIGFIGDYEAESRGGFHAVLPPSKVWSVPVWLVTHVDLHRTEKVQGMLSYLKAARPGKH